MSVIKNKDWKDRWKIKAIQLPQNVNNKFTVKMSYLNKLNDLMVNIFE